MACLLIVLSRRWRGARRVAGEVAEESVVVTVEPRVDATPPAAREEPAIA